MPIVHIFNQYLIKQEKKSNFITFDQPGTPVPAK